MKKNSCKIAAIALSAALSLAALSGCSGSKVVNTAASFRSASSAAAGSSGSSASSASAGTSIIRVTGSGTAMVDPDMVADYVSSQALVNIYDSLVYPEPGGKIKAWIADKWDVSADNLTYTFHLKTGVKFHSGNTLTAADVVYSLDRAKALGQGYGYMFTNVKSAAAKDDSTVVFTLEKPNGTFLNTLIRLYILDSKLMKEKTQSSGKYGANGDYGTNFLLSTDAGSGPYKVKEIKNESYVLCEKFGDFWGGWSAGAPDQFKIIDTSDGTTVRTMLTNKQLEISDQWQTNESLTSLAKISGVKIASIYDMDHLDIMLNTKKAPTDDINFRKALIAMMDYNQLQKLYPGSKIASGPVPFDVAGHDDTIAQAKQDLALAKEYLAKSKYAGKLSQYPVEILWNSDVPDQEKIVLLLQSSAQQLGVNIVSKKAPWISYTNMLSQVSTTPNGVIIYNEPNFDDAGSMLQLRYGLKTTGTWQQSEWLQNSALSSSIDAAMRIADQKTRFAAYAKIQQQIVNDIAPTLTLLDAPERRAYAADRIDWPAADAVEQGKAIVEEMGYMFYFHDFKVK